MVAEGKLVTVAEVKAETIRRVMGPEMKERKAYEEWMDRHWESTMGPLEPQHPLHPNYSKLSVEEWESIMGPIPWPPLEDPTPLDPQADAGVPARAVDAPQLELDLRRRPQVLSLGGGLDSFAALVEAIRRGEPPDRVGFVDVADPDGRFPGEWPGTYRHIREVVIPLCEREGIPFDWIDGKRYPVRDASSLWEWMWNRNQIPVAGPNRICTRIAKVERFEKWLDDTYPSQEVEVWIGFEAGEEARTAKDPNAGKPRPHKPGQAIRRNRFPLQEWDLCRCRCEELVQAAGYPVPRKSACVFCLAGETEVVTRAGIRPIRDLAGGIHVAEVRAFLTTYYGSDGTGGQELEEPMRTMRAKACLGLVTVEGAEYLIADIGMRMLEPEELLRAQFGRFAASYDLTAAKTKAKKVRLIGNSVCPEVAEAVVLANMTPEELARRAA